MKTTFLCGDRLRYAGFEPGASGCLVRHPAFPERLLMLTAGHVVLPSWAQQDDAILDAATGQLLGRLWSWTTFDGTPTADVALIWVDPGLVSPDFRGSLSAPTEVNHLPQKGEPLFIVPQPGQDLPRQALVREVGQDVQVRVSGPGWDVSPSIRYRGQIVADRMFSEGGDSGAIVLDAHGRAVGMIVAGSSQIGSVITPMGAILGNPAWEGPQLQLVGAPLPDATLLKGPPPPTFTPPAPPTPGDALDLSWLTASQALVARQVALQLAAGGLARMHQAAALANAYRESSLDPRARNSTSKEDSIGLFQLNRLNGEGKGRSVAELEQVDVQCRIVLDRVTRIDSFMLAATVDDAVDAFVRKFERPADPDKAVQDRIPFAKRFLGR